jgi:tRNA threonylcarbamoyladenosine biosynthesis protein TsaB
VGVATAKTLAYALGALVVGVNTLDVIAAQAATSAPRLSVALDAQRGEVFCATYERAAKDNDSPWSLIDGPRIENEARWLSSLKAGMAASGPALARLIKQLPPGVTVIEQHDWAPRAGTVAALAWARHLSGAYDDVWKLAPLYLRKSAAEEKLELKRN